MISGIHIRMDWRAVKFDWNRARAFLVTAEEGSLAAAARALDMNQPTLGRQVAALEEEIGVNLFVRRGRGLELTPNGMKLVEYVRAMGDAANQFSISAAGKTDKIEGSICITTTELLATYVLPKLVKKLREQEPGIEIEIISTNDHTDLNRREADIAIRSFRPSNADLVTKKLCETKGNLYAATSYLDYVGKPMDISKLNKANFIDIEQSGRLLSFLNSQGFSLSERNFPVTTKSHATQWELVKLGMGICCMIENIGKNEPLVERITLPRIDPFIADIWIVTHKDLKTNRRIRTVFDFLASELTSVLRSA